MLAARAAVAGGRGPDDGRRPAGARSRARGRLSRGDDPGAADETADGALAAAALPALLAAAAERDVVAVGPGLGRAGQTAELVRALARGVGGRSCSTPTA